MSRTMKEDAKEAFRVRVTFPWGVTIFGPYGTPGAARAAVTREAHDWRGNSYPAVIEKSKQEWETVE